MGRREEPPRSGAEEDDLIRRAVAGEAGAFAELVRPYRRRLKYACWRVTHDDKLAEDALWEGLGAAERSLAGFRGDCPFYDWLRLICVRRAFRLKPDEEHETVT